MPEGANDTVRYRISWTTGGFMIGLAALIDILQFLSVFLNAVPGLGIMVGFYLTLLGYCIFSLWFALNNVSFSSGRRAVSKLLTTLTSAVAEFIPFVSALPMTSINVAVVTLLARSEDREEAAEKRGKKEAQMEAYMRRNAQIAAANARLETEAAQMAAAANDNEPEEEARAA